MSEENAQAIAKVEPESQELTLPDEMNLQFLAEINAEVEKSLKEVSVGKLTSPTDLIGKVLNLNDCFTMEFDFKNGKGSELNVVYILSDDKNIYFSSQSLNVNRQRFANLYDKIRTANAATGNKKELTLTNVKFEKLTKGGVGDNKPIILSFTKDTQQVWS